MVVFIDNKKKRRRSEMEGALYRLMDEHLQSEPVKGQDEGRGCAERRARSQCCSTGCTHRP